MNIGFDAKRYFHNRTGLGNYSRDLIDTLIAEYPENKYFLFDTNPGSLDLPANTIAVVPRATHFMWRSYGIVQEIKLHRINVYHGLSNELPWGNWPAEIKKIVTIHDVIFKSFPKHYPLLDRKIYDRKTKHAVKTADCIIATSQATADDLVKHYRADSSKIRVVYQTCAPVHWKTYKAEEITRFKNARKLPQSFVLYVSSFQTRKNHLALLNALHKTGRSDIKLVLAGRAGETLDVCSEFIKANKLENQVTILCDIQNAELPLLYRAASSFVYPSMAEGFGIPLIEAACAGLPLAVNDIPVFNELSPEQAMVFNASDTKSIADALIALNQMKPTDYGTYLEKFRPEFAAAEMMKIYKEISTQ